jgi:Predicted flavoprotein involved in K+ transport
MNRYDVIIIGGGQSGLAVAYYLRRSGLRFVILDKENKPGGSWQHHWESLRLFSPAQWSSLPGVIMNGGADYYPSREETIAYLMAYESKYAFAIKRPVDVLRVTKDANEFTVETLDGVFYSTALVSATGSFYNPYVPQIDGLDKFTGTVIHSSAYKSPESFAGKRVAVVGEGNSGAQILAEVSKFADTIWVSQKEPRFLPDHIDGRYLFDAATQMYEAQKAGKDYKPPSLGDIVMVESVKEARARNVLNSVGALHCFTEKSIILANGNNEMVDVVIFCTGFKSSLAHLNGLDVVTGGKVDTIGTKAKKVDGLWMVGYGNWTGFASATLIGVGRSAKKTVEEIQAFVGQTIQK